MSTVLFEDLDLNPQILRAIKEMGFEEATPIQAQSISKTNLKVQQAT